MFFPHRLVFRVRNTEDVIGHAKLPPATQVSHRAVQTRSRQDSLRRMLVGSDIVAFSDPENPEALLKDPVLGSILATHKNLLFATDAETGKKSLRGDVVTIPVDRGRLALGTLWRLHITNGGTLQGDPQDDDYNVPQSWRDAAGRLAPVVRDRAASREGEGFGKEWATNVLAVYLDGRFRYARNAEAAIKALARGLGNVAYREDLFRSSPKKQYTDGELPKPEKTKKGESPETVSDSVRKALQEVYLVAERISTDRFGELENAFAEGDTLSRLQCLARFLAQTPHNLLDCEAFVTVLKNMAAIMRDLTKEGVSMEVYGPADSKLTTHYFVDAGELEVLQAVHAGSFKEKGPFLVRVKYRHPKAAGKPVNVHVGKSVMQDDGGENAKGSAAKDMQADMLGGTSVAVEMLRVAMDGAQDNHDFVFPVVSNRIGGGQQMNDIRRLSSGKTVEILNTDAEGRLILADGLGAVLRMLRTEGSTIGRVNCVDTLTGHAIVMGGNTNAVLGDNRALLRAIEDASIVNGEDIQGVRLKPIDKGVTKETSANLRNLHPLPIGPVSARGAQSGTEFIFEGAGLSEKTRRDAVNWDIAPSLENYKGGTTGDLKDWPWAVGEFLDTFHDRVMGRISPGDGSRRRKKGRKVA